MKCKFRFCEVKSIFEIDAKNVGKRILCGCSTSPQRNAAEAAPDTKDHVMMIAHYAHRLPANYDMSLIRSRANERGGRWSAVPELYFKAFLVREIGCLGAKR